jgi:hypothetical protein
MQEVMNKFFKDFEEEFGADIKKDDEICKRLYSALCNTEWFHDDYKSKDGVLCSFRYSGSLIARIRGTGCYMDWYCCAEPAIVSDDIRERMGNRGWRAKCFP